MLSSSQLVALGALLQGGLVAGIVFSGPQATPVVDGAWALDAHGWTPKPTDAPKFAALARRQREDDAGFCGYAEGDGENAAYCSVGACLLDTSFNWFGCCTGTVITDCAVVTGCVASASLSACLDDPACYNDGLLTGCDNSASPYCAYLYSVTAGSSFGHFECAPKQTTIEILATSTNSASDDDDRKSTKSDDDGDLFSIQTDTVVQDETSLVRPSRTRSSSDSEETTSSTTTEEEEQQTVTVTKTPSRSTTAEDGSSTDSEPAPTSSKDAGNRAFKMGVVEVLVAVVVVLGV